MSSTETKTVHGFEMVEEREDTAWFLRSHKNGDTTEVVIEPSRFGRVYRLRIHEENGDGLHLGHEEVGTFPTFDEALKNAKKWMKEHPHGLEGNIIY